MGRRSWTARVDRRGFLLGGGALAGLLLAGRLPAPLIAQPAFPADPFALGVASGDPLPDGVVLWTRLAPDPLSGGGMPPGAVEVEWAIAADDGMREVVQRGTALASPHLAHAVHVEVSGLEPSRTYWYQFRAGGAESVVGRTRTAPAAGSSPERLRFAFASCQNYEAGYFTAYGHMAAEELDVVLHLGDYIYEARAIDGRVRRHDGPEVTTLEQYRNRYALYKSDPDLRAAHAAFPFIVTWDDHEVSDNYAGDIDSRGTPAERFLLRRADAYQAYYEHQPLRLSSMPRGPQMQLYRRLAFGDLAEVSVLDTRQYRSDQPCGDGVRPRCDGVLDDAATLTGPAQERWLLDGLDASSARWQVIAQQVMMAQVDQLAGPGEVLILDQWSGYPAARNRILGHLRERGTPNVIVLTGDIHSSWVNDLVADFDDPDSPLVATEFVGTSISSGGNGAESRVDIALLLRDNPHVRFYNGRRGYVRCTLTPQRWQSEYRVVPVVTAPGGSVSTRATFVVEDGRPGALPA